MVFSFSSDPMSALLRLQRQLEDAFQHPLGFEFSPSGRGVHPPLNVFRADGEYVVRLEVPGVAAEDLRIDVQGQNLTLAGTTADKGPEGASLHRRERRRGEFSRSLQLPEDAELGSARAELRNGVLTLHVPLKAEARPARIPISGS